ncbi:MAG: hypothetical protein MI741_13190 [Rhodospirillales bacterium]|nr:hypothetical protein [Rhodospirillales bacterium]
MFGDKGIGRLLRERRKGEDRREDAERRRDGSGRVGADRRNHQERRQGDRRRLRYGVLLKTARPVDVIEDWLDTYCKGDWHIVLDGVEADLRTKQTRIMFELEEDKHLLSTQFQR